MDEIKEGALIFEKKEVKNLRLEKIMFCSDTIKLKDVKNIIEKLRSMGLNPFIETHPKYGTCIVLKQKYLRF